MSEDDIRHPNYQGEERKPLVKVAGYKNLDAVCIKSSIFIAVSRVVILDSELSTDACCRGGKCTPSNLAIIVRFRPLGLAAVLMGQTAAIALMARRAARITLIG